MNSATINTTGDITTRNVLGNGADFSRLQATELNIYNTLSSGTFGSLQASINNAGLLTCKGVNAGSSLIQTTSGVQATYTDILGIVYNKGISVRDSTYTIEEASITNAGLLTCRNIDISQIIYSRGVEVRNPLNVTIASIVNTGWITCKNTDISETMYSRGIEIRNPLNTASLTVDTNGTINTSGNINCALIDVTSNVYCRYLAVRDVGNTLDILKLNQNGTINANIVMSTTGEIHGRRFHLSR
jgi:hypothetical protein